MNPKEMNDREKFFDDECQYRKPPLGVKPRWLHEEQRLQDLGGAIYRYLNEQYPIKPEWIEEYNEIIKRMEERK
jgi:hypothetical protein